MNFRMRRSSQGMVDTAPDSPLFLGATEADNYTAEVSAQIWATSWLLQHILPHGHALVPIHHLVRQRVRRTGGPGTHEGSFPAAARSIGNDSGGHSYFKKTGSVGSCQGTLGTPME